jgi:beta-glucosidase
MTAKRFPDGFLWGAATSAYQVEGSPLADGAGPSIWQRFSHTPGRVRGGDTGDVASDHYRRWKEDVSWMRELGLTAYRFSVSWSRVLPDGTGRVNRRGLDFYDALVDALVESGIAPVATLYHWDLPAALDDRGGWQNRDSADWFAEYARVLFRALDDRVALWATLNEPWVVSAGGYLHGGLAPGHRSLFEPPIVSHNLLRAHGRAVAAYRAEGRRKIGLAVNLEPKHSASTSAADRAAARRDDAFLNRWFLDPVLLGRYPEEMREIFREAWPEFPASDFDDIRSPLDFLGVNYYTRAVVRDDPKEWPARARRVRPRWARTEMDWEVFPEGLFETLVSVRDRYGPIPLYVTENGAAFDDPKPKPKPVRGYVDDPLRVSYLRDHLRAARRAIDAGVDLRGYFVWSLLDNFEWSYGYSKKFGILQVDPATQDRTPKASARFYADVIRSNGAGLENAGADPASPTRVSGKLRGRAADRPVPSAPGAASLRSARRRPTRPAPRRARSRSPR